MTGLVPARRRPSLGDRSGFTMIELAVAVVLATMVVAGLYQVFIMQSRQLQFLDMQAEMNQNLRFATDVVTRTVRQAGLGTGTEVYGALGNGGDSDAVLAPVLSANAQGWGSGSDAITVTYQDPSLAMNTDLTKISGCDTDVLSFDMDMHSYATQIGSFSAGEFLLCNDFANSMGMESYLWVITGTDSGNGDISVTANNGFDDYSEICPSTENLTPVMTCSRGEVVTFYIDDDSDDGYGPGSQEHPVLMMDLDFDFESGTGPQDDDVPLVDDIEDLQFSYCLEDPTEGSYPCSNSTYWYQSLLDTDAVWMVTVSLLARSRREEATRRYRSTRPALHNRPPGVTEDSYYRQVLSTQVSLRSNRFYSNVYE